MTSKEELMRNTDSVIWGYNSSTFSQKTDTTHRICEWIWSVLNSRACNVVIVIFVFAEGIVILSELLITLGIVQDPEWRLRNYNCTNTSLLPNEIFSPKLKRAKEVFTYCSLSFLTLFVFEIFLRIVTGKTRFIVQGIEVFDAIVVLVAFGLDVMFYMAPTRSANGKESAILIILLRLWRINNVVKSIIKASKAKLGNIISVYQKEKIYSDHKVDLLILKVEDLEHEVAYLKEKLKKAEKEPLFIKRRRTKDNPTATIHTKPASITINIEPNIVSGYSSPVTETCSIYSHSPQHGPKDKVSSYADNAAAIIVDEALLLASHLGLDESIYGKYETAKNKQCCKLRRRPDGSIESGYGSAASSINWNRVRENTKIEDKKPPTVPLKIAQSSLKCPESSPESGYGSGGSQKNRNNSTSPHENTAESVKFSSSNSQISGTVFVFPENLNSRLDSTHDVQLEVLDEITEIERIRNVEFNPHRHDKDIPITSL